MQLIRRLVVGNGLKTNAAWERMAHLERVAWLNSLDAVHVRAQASVRAAGARRTVEEVITSWVYHGYLSIEAAAAALAVEANP